MPCSSTYSKNLKHCYKRVGQVFPSLMRKFILFLESPNPRKSAFLSCCGRAFCCVSGISHPFLFMVHKSLCFMECPVFFSHQPPKLFIIQTALGFAIYNIICHPLW
ncbi:hypothetical protein PanWU01x14_174820, partial [Parasponia andersonii]